MQTKEFQNDSHFRIRSIRTTYIHLTNVNLIPFCGACLFTIISRMTSKNDSNKTKTKNEKKGKKHTSQLLCNAQIECYRT